MSESRYGDGSRPEDRDRGQKLSHAPGSPRRQVQFGHVCCLHLGEAVSLHLHVGPADWTLSMNESFTLHPGSGPLAIDPGLQQAVDGTVFTPLLRLIGAQAHAPEWDRTGHVAIEFEDGSSLTCGPDPTETAWMVVGPHGQTWSCRPGGRIVRNEDRAGTRWSRV